MTTRGEPGPHCRTARMTVTSVPFVGQAQALHGGHRTLSLSSSASSPSFVWKPGPAMGLLPRVWWPGCQKLLSSGAGLVLSCVHRCLFFLRVTPGRLPRCKVREQADRRCSLARALVRVQPDAQLSPSTVASRHQGPGGQTSKSACFLTGPWRGDRHRDGGAAVSFQPLSLSHTLW